MRYTKKVLLFIALFFCMTEEAPGVLAEEAAPEATWKRNVSVGYNKSSGNTDSSELNASLFVSRNRVHVDEITLKGDIYYSSSDKKMDAQKWNGSGRYAFSFGQKKKWYHFYKLEADHDRFANIDYRLLPNTGLGYWFHDTDSMKLMMEAAGGYEHTEYRDATEETKETVFISRGFLEKTLFENAKISQDVFFYPVIDDFSDYRLHSETVFTNPVSDKLALNVSVIDDYDSKPAGDTKKNDLRVLTSLTYSF
ncbi:MAG: DUF481 domain-containing protein [Candidatus Gorgyraea atricola]|nr:DUF481 domain-containing protein [Candidatus Gorgyraea atricola]